MIANEERSGIALEISAEEELDLPPNFLLSVIWEIEKLKAISYKLRQNCVGCERSYQEEAKEAYNSSYLFTIRI